MPAETIEFREKTIDSLFYDSVFLIPDFQRPYSWTQSEVETLFDDIYESWQSSAESYFLGPIVVTPSDEQGVHRKLNVLDGQQRLTTISLIFLHIYNMMSESTERSNLFTHLVRRDTLKLQPQKSRSEDSDFNVYKEIIYHNDVLPDLFKKHLMAKALVVIRSRFLKYFSDGENSNGFEDFIRYIQDNVVVSQGMASSYGAAFKLFEALNDRGMPLLRSDLVKNRIYSLLDSNDYEIVKNSWSVIEECIGRDDMDLFLRYFFISNQTFIRREEIFRSYKEKYLGTLTSSATVKNFVCNQLEPAAKVLVELRDPSSSAINYGISKETAQRLKRISKLNTKMHLPFLLSVFEKDLNNFGNAVRFVETATIRYLVIGGHGANKLEPMYAQMAQKIRKGENFKEVVKGSSVYNLIWDDEKIQEAILEKDNIGSSSTWRELLKAIELHRWQARKELSGPKDVHIEHILPQNPSDESLREANISTTEVKDYINKLGNLTLLSSRLNIQARNKAFSKKKLDHYSSSDIKLTNELLAYNSWGSSEIVQRTKLLAQELCNLFPHPSKFIE